MTYRTAKPCLGLLLALAGVSLAGAAGPRPQDGAAGQRDSEAAACELTCVATYLAAKREADAALQKALEALDVRANQCLATYPREVERLFPCLQEVEAERQVELASHRRSSRAAISDAWACYRACHPAPGPGAARR